MLDPYLPVELTDSIIDFVNDFWDEINFSPDDRRCDALASLARVSRAFRRRVNYHRFSKVAIKQYDHVSTVHNLLKDDAICWPKSRDQLRWNIRRFQLALEERRKHLRVVLSTQSAELEGILANIFSVPSTSENWPSSPLSFSWSVSIRVRYEGLHCVDWNFISQTLQSTLRAFLQNPHLEEVRLIALQNVPRDLLEHSRFLSLQLTDTTFADVVLASDENPEHDASEQPLDTKGVLNQWHLKHLRCINTDHSTTPLDCIGSVIYNAPLQLTPTFRSLYRLSCCIRDNDDLEKTIALLQHAKLLTELDLAFPEPDILLKPLPYDTLTKLEVLSLTYHGALRPRAREYRELVHKIVSPCVPTFPPVRRLRLFLSIFSTNKGSSAMQNIFHEHNFSSIDNFVADKAPSTLKAIEIYLQVVVTVPECTAAWRFFNVSLPGVASEYAQNTLFPRLAALRTSLLMVVVKSTTYYTISAEHYSHFTNYKWSYAHNGGAIVSDHGFY
ncbi:hypothetical protein BDN70DRAFT_180278 [Pholiota conissans]|uniref:Uncharacterized protein n=1 Tax=Pholiota conissans TaxID=109636 RepID=A0A9P5ZAK0_9AGAR|nr:hypothetical protein BDN70DRAFT_180278 [Pholiota conissans]